MSNYSSNNIVINDLDDDNDLNDDNDLDDYNDLDNELNILPNNNIIQHNVDQNDEHDYIRYFRCLYDGNEFGRFRGKYPKNAACKALTSIYKRNIIQMNESISFALIEITRKSKKRQFNYVGERKLLDNPIYISISSHLQYPIRVTISHKNIVKRYR